MLPSIQHFPEPREALVARIRPRLDALVHGSGDLASAAHLVRDALTLCRELANLDAEDNEVADVAFVAATDLRGTLDRLNGSPTDDERAHALRRVLRTVHALEQVLGIPRAAGGARDRTLQISLATRRRYATLRRSVLSPAPPTNAVAMARSFARVRLQMTLLVQSDEYPLLRPADRDQVADLSQRLDRVLANRDALDVRQAEHLWQDLSGFARLSAAINRRAELVENDTAIIDEASEWLESGREIPTRMRMRLETLSGLDDEVDALIERYEWNVEGWRRALIELHERLVRPATGRFTRIKN